MDDAPIFIVGANRSGTTLLRLILNAHSRIAIPEEMNYFPPALAPRDPKHWQQETIGAGFIDYFLQEECPPLEEQGLDVQRIRDELVERSPLSLREPYVAILKEWARLHGKKRWGEKTPGNLYYADVLIDMFPDARFIYLVRDPRGGVASMQRVDFFSDDIVFNALARRKAMTQGRALLETHVPSEQRTTIRYEDLVTAPESTVQTICAFIEESYEPGMLEYHRSAGEYMKDEAAHGFNATATQPISPKIAQKWRKRLTPREVALIEHLCKPEMRESGYTPSNRAPDWPDRISALIKTGYWHWQCWHHRDIRHYVVPAPMFARLRNWLDV